MSEDIDYPNAYDGWRRPRGGGSRRVGEIFEKAAKAPEPEPAPSAGDKVCRLCQKNVPLLHVYPGDSRRSVCATCQGNANRAVTNRMGEAVKAMKASAERGEVNEKAKAFLVDNGYQDTVDYFAKKAKEQKSATSGRGGFE